MSGAGVENGTSRSGLKGSSAIRIGREVNIEETIEGTTGANVATLKAAPKKKRKAKKKAPRNMRAVFRLGTGSMKYSWGFDITEDYMPIYVKSQ